MPGIEPGAFHMQSERSTTELHPLLHRVFVYYQVQDPNRWPFVPTVADITVSYVY